jgi:Ni,Fe-hydrogenase III small subunit/ferredoxin
MLEWIPRGLRQGRVTTRYPRRSEPAPRGYRGRIEVLDATDAEPGLAKLCPTGAISVDGGGELTLDRGRCILCGACVEAAPSRFAFGSRYQTAARSRQALVVPDRDDGLASEPTRRALGEQARALRRSIHVRHIDCGSDGSEEWEIQALWNPYYDIQRLGYFLTAAPRHADVLLVTGPVTAAMRSPLQRTWEVMPEPKALVAVGTDACSGGLCGADELTAGGVDRVLPVDVYVPGSPPAPIAILHGLLLATGVLRPQEMAA